MRLTLRAQIAVASALIALIVVGLAGALFALRIDQRDRNTTDAELRARAERVVSNLDQLLAHGDLGHQSGADELSTLLDGTESLVRLIDQGKIIAERGAVPNDPLAIPDQAGFATVQVDGIPWRSYVEAVDNGRQVQVLQSLQPINERRAANTRLVALVTLLAAVLSGAGGWLTGRRLLRPLERLTFGATVIADDPDPVHRLPAVTQPAEIAALSSTLNGMLDRLSDSTQTTRRFAADIGHELRGPLSAATTYLETLLASSDLTDHAREAMTAAYEQQQRMVARLVVLQVLARGDAGALPPPTDIEPGTLMDEHVRLARRRHPTVTFTMDDASNGASIAGWRDGLAIALDNLLDNAALHGRPHGHVAVHVTAHADQVIITVADDGPGIPAESRQHLRQRFVRGVSTTHPGTGLGFALADQQASLHGGKMILEDAPSGGLQVELRLPRG